MTRRSDNKAVRIRNVFATPTQRKSGKMGDEDRLSFLNTDVGNKKRWASTLRYTAQLRVTPSSSPGMTATRGFPACACDELYHCCRRSCSAVMACKKKVCGSE
eukprot:scaffold3234_cov166-Amphora_coffeaeformis.AAC.9